MRPRSARCCRPGAAARSCPRRDAGDCASACAATDPATDPAADRRRIRPDPTGSRLRRWRGRASPTRSRLRAPLGSPRYASWRPDRWRAAAPPRGRARDSRRRGRPAAFLWRECRRFALAPPAACADRPHARSPVPPGPPPRGRPIARRARHRRERRGSRRASVRRRRHRADSPAGCAPTLRSGPDFPTRRIAREKPAVSFAPAPTPRKRGESARSSRNAGRRRRAPCLAREPPCARACFADRRPAGSRPAPTARTDCSAPRWRGRTAEASSSTRHSFFAPAACLCAQARLRSCPRSCPRPLHCSQRASAACTSLEWK